jgi:hypothetical protein
MVDMEHPEQTPVNRLTDPNCFGEINTGAAQKEDTQPGLGEHASDPVPSLPGKVGGRHPRRQ